MCWGKADYELEAWKGRVAREDTPEEEREPRVEWREPAPERDEEHEREEVLLERV